MRVALCLLFFAAAAYGRVGERLEDFKKRVGEKPFESDATGEYFFARFMIDDVFVSVVGRSGVILSERYESEDREKLAAIAEKQPRSVSIPDFPGQNARDAMKPVFIERYGETLRVMTWAGKKAEAVLGAQREKKGAEKKPNVEKF